MFLCDPVPILRRDPPRLLWRDVLSLVQCCHLLAKLTYRPVVCPLIWIPREGPDHAIEKTLEGLQNLASQVLNLHGFLPVKFRVAGTHRKQGTNIGEEVVRERPTTSSGLQVSSVANVVSGSADHGAETVV